LQHQIEGQTQNYRVEEEEVEVALALIKSEGFDKAQNEDGEVVFTTEITYHPSREHLLLSLNQLQAANHHDFGFHYDPYNFDSNPEKSFFQQLMSLIDVNPETVADVYFTGGITDPDKTDFFIEYKGKDGRWHRYSPDFLVRRKDGRSYIVEIKAEKDRKDEVDGISGKKAMAIRGWEKLNPEKLQYQMIFTNSDQVGINQLTKVQAFIKAQVTHE
jgi:hypothetical protein